jgi:hypothetical protein
LKRQHRCSGWWTLPQQQPYLLTWENSEPIRSVLTPVLDWACSAVKDVSDDRSTVSLNTHIHTRTQYARAQTHTHTFTGPWVIWLWVYINRRDCAPS